MEHNGFWEPWQPKVGDTVKISVSPECMFFCPDGHSWHWPHLQGQTGRVVARVYEGDGTVDCMCTVGDKIHEWTGDLPVSQGHYYVVHATHFRLGGWYAAIELEPVEAP